MALTAVHTAMHIEDSRNVHPFFTKTSKNETAEPPANNADTNSTDPNDDQDYSVQDTSPTAAKPRKKRTRKIVHSKDQPSLETFARRPAVQSNEADVKANADEPTLEEDLNLDRRKRRKTDSPEHMTNATDADQVAKCPPLDLYQQLQAEAETTGTQDVVDNVMVDVMVASTPKGETPGSTPPIAQHINEEAVPESSLPQPAENLSQSATPPDPIHVADTGNGDAPVEFTENLPAKVTPKKQIKVTKTGKLVSSPPKKVEPASILPKRRGRPRKATKNTNFSSTVTIIRYGSDKPSKLALGQKIDAILNSGKTSKKVSIAPPKPAGPPKTSHPFFTGKVGQKKVEEPAKQEAERRPVIPRVSACTPGKLRAETRKEQDDEDVPSFGMASKTARLAKQSGLVEPSWPSRETAHVRNLAHDGAQEPPLKSLITDMSLKPAKLKSNAYVLSTEEEIITRLAEQLPKNSEMSSIAGSHHFTPSEDVRLPIRVLTTGIDIQRMVRAHIQAPVETLAQRLFAKTHPAISTLFDEIEHTLTPFDEGKCESQAWAQKYRPGRADHVLQPGREAATLKDWLKNLTVMAVGDPSKAGAPTDTKRPPKKKRKTAAYEFIVFSDEEEEDEDMIELESSNVFTSQQPSVRRPRWTRNKNVVLLSGPHGCGKSATVHAVAKELDFEVFEIHSGVRRSGKDIQDKVGDMTANHLVNHQRGDVPVKPKPTAVTVDNDTDNERENAFQKDLDSGRQGTMKSFFTAKPAAQPQPKPKPKVPAVVKSPAKMRTIPAAQAMLPMTGTSRKSQKQSLILIEEADILFDEDQNFWAHIIKLAAQSKRPIVITCTDELQIPSQALPLAAVLRLTQPPVDLATDYLVALAGREGHILQRQAISDLYISKDHDLRASITELNFWCQMSVGDKKGGLEWMYQRWPPGKDVDANGRSLRVASEDTYQSGMGWLSHNVLEARDNVIFNKEEELLTEGWNDWGISPTNWRVAWSAADQPRNDSTATDQITQLSNLDKLDRLASLSDALSAADIYSRIDLPSYNHMHDQPMDPTLPLISPKERLSYTIDAPLLQADPKTDFHNTDTALATTTHLLCHRAFPDLTPHHPEQSHTAQILRHKISPQAPPLTRSTFSAALDILAIAPSTHTPDTLIATSLDRPFALITLDIAPYVRSIVAHEQVLETRRVRLGNLLSEGGRRRGRTTRAARLAVEGGERTSMRRERWFHPELGFEMVMRTAGAWAGMGWRGEDGEGSLAETMQSESLAGTQRSETPGGSQQAVGDGRDVEMIVDAEVE
ncbi:hypothetical protein C7974DRAFT_446369 [Boeremia exigua]|uniref:uncharacterized protein n=1 Tax=Boeremia exigua TaxID=749465 RepID=UPI001E8EF30E|nr:uncharacterized protein C7974DRAFT_446369 [Boeremia exigua]KAH6642034.1 hypothetical protein C7974DRAFT_446369 [Boeremia exigua]